MPTHVNVGDVLVGKYRVERVLGIGGMGMVLAAMHLELEQRVAIKLMLPDATRSPHAVDRFLREARSAVRLRSEHVCRVLDVGKLDDGAPYIVMELMEGQDFADLIQERGPIPVVDAVEYLLQAIEGVAEAHANRIVHRDLKPGNLFVATDNDGTPLVKVLDFGISKSNVAGGAATKTGDIMGSPSYMAPEQMLSSKDVDARADVWALGVILYQAVTGKLPFEGDTLPVLCMAVIHDQPKPPIEWRPELPQGFSDLIMCCLEKPLDRRFVDVGALAGALARFGGPNAIDSAARVSKVLRRNGPAMTPPVGVAVTPVDNDPTVRRPTELPAATQPAANFGTPTPGPMQISTTLGGSSGQFAAAVGRTDLQDGPQRKRRWWLVGAAATALLGAAGGVFAVMMSSRTPTSTAAAGSGSANVTASVVTPTPAVTPTAPRVVTPPAVDDDRQARSRRIVRETLGAFVEWAKTHKGDPCPRATELSSGEMLDGWGTEVVLTCTDQPENVIAGVISAGPDARFNTADDIESWKLGDPAIAHIAGPRWVASKPNKKAAKTARTAPTGSTAPIASSKQPAASSTAATTPTAASTTPTAASTTGPAATVTAPPPPPPPPPKTEPAMTDKFGIPTKR